MYTHILHATDLQENHFHLCQKAVEIAKRFHATLYLLHVIEPPASLQLAQGLGLVGLASPITDDAKTVMTVLGEALNIPSTNLFVEVGSIKTHVLNKVAELNCTLVIVGSHTSNNLPSFLNSSAQSLTQEISCDTLILS